jgi:hypothetical protein
VIGPQFIQHDGDLLGSTMDDVCRDSRHASARCQAREP